VGRYSPSDDGGGTEGRTARLGGRKRGERGEGRSQEDRVRKRTVPPRKRERIQKRKNIRTQKRKKERETYH